MIPMRLNDTGANYSIFGYKGQNDMILWLDGRKNCLSEYNGAASAWADLSGCENHVPLESWCSWGPCYLSGDGKLTSPILTAMCTEMVVKLTNVQSFQSVVYSTGVTVNTYNVSNTPRYNAIGEDRILYEGTYSADTELATIAYCDGILYKNGEVIANGTYREFSFTPSSFSILLNAKLYAVRMYRIPLASSTIEFNYQIDRQRFKDD